MSNAPQIAFHCDTPGCSKGPTTAMSVSLPGGFYCLECGILRARAILRSPNSHAHARQQAHEVMQIARLVGPES